MRVERVDPAAAAEAAAAVLADAWKPPCLAYPAPYLRWELGAPGPPAVAVLAADGGEAVGFSAALPRRVRFRGTCRDVYLVTFVAVRPGWQGRGVAGRLRTALLAALRPAGLPFVTFVLTGSGGPATVERDYPRLGWVVRPLGEFRLHAAVPAELPAPPAGTPADLRRLPPRVADAESIVDDPSDAQWEHWSVDTRPRGVVVARGPAGEVVAAATAIRMPVVSAAGPGEVTVVEALRFAPGVTPTAVRDVLAAAAGRWPDPGGRTVVTASNVQGIDPPLLRAAGLRQTPTAFCGYLASPDPSDALLAATSTDLPVV